MIGLLAAAALRTATTPPETTTATTSSTTIIELAVWETAAEIVLPPSIVVPTRVSAADGIVEVDYDIDSMALGDAGAARPTDWALLANGREYLTTVDPYTSRVVFDVGFDFDPSTIEGLRLDGYVLWSPIQAEFQPAADDFSTHELAPGVFATLDLVRVQSVGAIVRVHVSSDRIGASADLAVEGRGPGWISASANFGGGGLWTMSFEGGDLPDPIPLLVRGIISVDVPTSVVTTLKGLPVG